METKQEMHDRILKECKKDLNHTGTLKQDYNPHWHPEFLLYLNSVWCTVHNCKLQEVKTKPHLVQNHE